MKKLIGKILCFLGIHRRSEIKYLDKKTGFKLSVCERCHKILLPPKDRKNKC